MLKFIIQLGAQKLTILLSHTNWIAVSFEIFMQLNTTRTVQGWADVKPYMHHLHFEMFIHGSYTRKMFLSMAHCLFSVEAQFSVMSVCTQDFYCPVWTWDYFDIREILPIGVIRCASAKASPIEKLPWVTFAPSGCLKKDNWSNVHAHSCKLIKAKSTG